jgi:hypothetical protein
MPANTPIFGFPYPLGTDPVAQGDNVIQELAEDVEAVISTQVGLRRVTTCTVGTFSGGTSPTASNGVVTIGTSNTSVEVANAFSTTFDNYLITVTGCTPSANVDLRLRLGAKTTNYQWGLTYNAYNSTPSALGSATDTHFRYMQGLSVGAKFDTQITVLSPWLTQPTRVAAFYCDGGAAGHTSGFDATSTSYTSFQLAVTSGNLTGGVIRVYGYTN